MKNSSETGLLSDSAIEPHCPDRPSVAHERVVGQEQERLEAAVLVRISLCRAIPN